MALTSCDALRLSNNVNGDDSDDSDDWVTETVLLHSLNLAAIQSTWGGTSALRWASDVFQSLTGYGIRSEDNLATAYEVDWDTSALVLSTGLSTAEECLLAILGGLKTIISGETPAVDATATAATETAPEIAPTPEGVTVLAKKRLARTLRRAAPARPDRRRTVAVPPGGR